MRKLPGFHEWKDSNKNMLGRGSLSQKLREGPQHKERFGEMGK